MVEPIGWCCLGVAAILSLMHGDNKETQKAEMQKMQREDPATLQIIINAGNAQQRLTTIVAKIPHSLTQDDAFVKRKDWEHGSHASTGRPDCFYHAGRQCDYHQLCDAVLHARLHGKGHIGSSAAKELHDAIEGMLRDAARLGFH